MAGVKAYPVSETCSDRAQRIRSNAKCISAFRDCCEFANKLREKEPNKLLILARMRKYKSFISRMDMWWNTSSRIWENMGKYKGDGFVNLLKPLYCPSGLFQKEFYRSPKSLVVYP